MNYDEREYLNPTSIDENSFDTEEKVKRGGDYVEDRLWEKVERVGSKIRFANEVKALYRYMLDKYVPWYRKSIVIAALIYFISPIDAIPDIAPLVGYLDDLGVIAAVIKYMGHELVPYYE
ncbi:MAG: YkvA family protein [Melioribacteraceae bacterium]